MKRNAVLGAAAFLALSAGISAGAARSCSFEKQGSGFNAFLPLGESKIGVSCTEWLGSTSLCMAGDFSGGRYLEIQGGSRYGAASIPVPLSGKTLVLAADAGKKSFSLKLE